MPLDPAQVRQRLKEFNLKALFVEELGWEHHAASHQVTVDGRSYQLNAVAHKRGFAAFICEPGPDGRIPDYATRRKIDRQVTKLAHEHLVIFVDTEKTTQIWQWLKKEPGKPVACRERAYYQGQPGEAVIQPLQLLAFSIEEEAGLALPEVTIRVRAALDVEKVTKRFYDRFKAEHAAFLKFLKGIPDEDMQRWYVSVMLNRLMFIYFIQKKGFLDSNPNYLQVKLADTKRRGKDSFYKDFLCPLFFEGFAKKESERSAATNKLLGKVPYLNGGLFLRHQIEDLRGEQIQIADAAFDKLFAFFEQYHWHLDERPLRADNEINPDVLGYIFEKYINQKQMGAYYSKEDITGYISQNTVIPFLFDQARKECKIAFEGPNPIWRLLQADPDSYIYDAVKHGISVDIRHKPAKRLGYPIPLPPEVSVGLDDVARRGEWNKAASGDCALPTEIWREVVARRKRCEEVRGKLVAGEIRSINDLITYNLDIRQFAQDVIESSEGPELLRAFYKAIKSVSVLDPACGSGAFLFAALNILESLYEACLDRMEAFLNELERSGQKHRPEKFADFKAEIERIHQHPNRKYFVFKSIIVNNLFGVDIMEEATEICKLRLFLKLVAQIERLDQIEPLPDIDFNIRAGNTLVGYASYDDVKRAVTSKLDFEKTMDRIEEGAQEIDRLFGRFREQQTSFGGEIAPSDKEELRSRLRLLERELNHYLAGEYAVRPSDRAAFEKWQKQFMPFHWFIDFYGIMKSGGFDVLIGNPPYKDLRAVVEYAVKGYATLSTGNLYPLFIERSLPLSKSGGRVGVIVPVSSISTEGYVTLQDLLSKYSAHFSSYDDRPSRLFDGLEHIQLTIHLIQRVRPDPPEHFATECVRWSAVEREVLFSGLQYQPIKGSHLPGCIPKLSSSIELAILQKIWEHSLSLGQQQVKGGPWKVYYSRKVHNFLQALDFVPKVYDGKGNLRPPSELKDLSFGRHAEAALVFCLLNSSLFRWFVNVFSDCRHVNRREVEGFRIDLRHVLSGDEKRFLGLSNSLSERLKETSELRTMSFSHDRLKVQCIVPKRSKDIIDEIDDVLARHYGFTSEELDFIRNYAIRYRMGDDLQGAED